MLLLAFALFVLGVQTLVMLIAGASFMAFLMKRKPEPTTPKEKALARVAPMPTARDLMAAIAFCSALVLCFAAFEALITLSLPSVLYVVAICAYFSIICAASFEFQRKSMEALRDELDAPSKASAKLRIEPAKLLKGEGRIYRFFLWQKAELKSGKKVPLRYGSDQNLEIEGQVVSLARVWYAPIRAVGFASHQDLADLSSATKTPNNLDGP